MTAPYTAITIAEMEREAARVIAATRAYADRFPSATRTPRVSAPATATVPPTPAVAGNTLSAEADACRSDPASSLTTAAGCAGDCAPVGFLMER